MATVTLKGNAFETAGNLPAVGNDAPAFTLVGTDLQDATLDTYAGKRKVLSIFPSVDTPVCANSVRAFNEKAGSADNTVVLNISMDLPFAQKRFCGAEGLENVTSLSAFRNPEFGTNYGVVAVGGPLKGFFSRAIVVLDENNKVVYNEQVPEIAQEPNYEAALAALK